MSDRKIINHHSQLGAPTLRYVTILLFHKGAHHFMLTLLFVFDLID